jgi:hypothetical protein
MLLLLLAILALLLHGDFVPGNTLVSNDGPLGRLMSECHRLPERFTGCWVDLNSVGYRDWGAAPSISFGLQFLLGPVAFSKLYVPLALLILGCGAWCFFRQSGLAAPACILGGLAAVLRRIPLPLAWFSLPSRRWRTRPLEDVGCVWRWRDWRWAWP